MKNNNIHLMLVIFFMSSLCHAESTEKSLIRAKIEKENTISDIYLKESALAKKECVIHLQKTLQNYTAEQQTGEQSEISRQMMVACLAGQTAVLQCDKQVANDGMEKHINCISQSRITLSENYQELADDALLSEFSTKTDNIRWFIADVFETDTDRLIRITSSILNTAP